MKFRIAVLSLATLFCCNQVNAKSSLLSKLSEKDPWEFMQYHLYEGPSARVKSYLERKFNIVLPIGFLTAAISSLIFRGYLEDEGNFNQSNKAQRTAQATAILGAITTLWGFIRNYWFLVWAAEKEIFNELLDDWSNTRKVLPEELIGTFEYALRLRTSNPDQFKKELPRLITALQKETDVHMYERHYYSLRHSLYRLIHALRDRAAAQAQEAETSSSAQPKDSTAPTA